MASPSLENLRISSPPAKSVLPNNSRPLSPSPSPPPEGDGTPNGDAESKPSVNGTHPAKVPVEDTPPQTPGHEATSPSNVFANQPTPTSTAPTPAPVPTARPTPVATASTPVLGRPPVGRPVPGRGGMPMAMGMRGPAMGLNQMQSRLPPSLQAKMDKVAARGAPAPSPHQGPAGPNPNATSMGALLRSQALGGGVGGGASGSGSLPGPASGPLSLAARRAGGAPRPNLAQMAAPPSAPAALGARGGLGGRRMGPPGGMTLSSMAGGKKEEGSKFTDFGQIMDPSGSLRFSSKAVLHAKGVDFEDGQSFQINMDEIEIIGELGKGNYGSVQQVFHRPSQIYMAMKEIRLELDESKLNGIIMELDILHRAVAPEIVEFYGGFTIESCVYYCMEYMDAGSLDKLTGGGVPAKDVTEDTEDAEIRVPEPVLRRITAAIVRGLGFLKDELQIMHRDVKPTNVLINKKGEIKLCDFGVSGQLEKSLAKTNIGCQSYMAPERIKGESQNQLSTYTVSSDVWSVGLSIIELAKGCYPYPPETFANVFAQLQAIVYGPAPTLPKGYSADAHDFVANLLKDPNARPTYAELLKHPFLLADKDAEVDMVEWVAQSLERRAARGVKTLSPVEA
ncbi:kinase-like domain-containing protein [Naematelia encephala]|uniref:mitogen-activated protein kinase kinase n=1 Tax=Naematelia encephala TaxID=71784 RepID=A0A1Y2B482_9TREE|nr:kinase-like domain-containing protein [Naematelia encephala]